MRMMFASLVVWLVCLGWPPTLHAQNVRVMTWNVHGNIGTSAANSSAGAAAVARVVNYLQPDVFLINEVDDGTAAVNSAALTNWVSSNLPYLATGTFYVAVSTESSDIQRDAAISRYPILTPSTYPDVSSGLRGMFSFQLQLTGTNRLQVFDVHLKCCSDGTSCQTKQDEAQLFSNDMAAWAATNSAPYIFAGDLNEDQQNLECPAYNVISMLLTNGGLVEFKPTMLNSNEYRTWSTGTITPSIRFDYIWASTNRLSPLSGLIFSTGNQAINGLYTNASPQNLVNDSATASDHYPVFANYLFPTNSSTPLQNIQTVFIIPMENQNWSSILGNTSSAPYINNTLLPMASHSEQYYNQPGLHPSLPNYLWLEAGTNFNVISDVLPSTGHQSSTNHLVTLLKKAGISWRSYNEDICGCICPLANTNLYVPRHNPFVYFDDVTNTNDPNSAYCISNDVAYSKLVGDLQSNTVARYNWVSPNLCNDMHNTCSPTNNPILQGDGWLSRELPKILNSQAYSNNGAVFIVWDEGAGISDGPIGMIVLSPLAKGAGYSNTNHYTHSSTLLTLQEVFNVGPLLGDAVNAIDLSDLFVFGAKLAVSPATGLTSSGTIGGPFSPTNQTYTLSNTGGVAMVWAVTKTANWLTLSATNGTLAAGAGTNVTVSINTNANSLSGGSYSDAVSFATINGSGNTTRLVSLAVSNPAPQLSVNPVSGFSSAGAPGGPFSPGGQNYTLSNPGAVTLNWTANKSAAWLTLSATNGTLAPSSNTIVTVSINSNANSLSAGNYSDTVGFPNTTTGSGNTTRSVNLNVSSFGFYDDFSTFNSGNLVGQQSWTQSAAASTLPLQVTGGKVVIPYGQSADNQDAYKNFARTNITVFYGITVTVSNAPNTSTPSYFTALNISNNATSFNNYRLTARTPNAANTNFVFGVRITGETGDPFTFGTAGFSYGTQRRVIIEADSGGTVMKLFVDPTSSTLAEQTPYLTHGIASGTPPPSVGAFVISQFASVSFPNDGVAIGKAVVADNFATAYNALLGALPPVANFTASPTSGAEPLAVTFTDTSTGTLPLNLSWNLGDSTTTNTAGGASILYVYPAGTYTITLTASNSAGISSIVSSNLITVDRKSTRLNS